MVLGRRADAPEGFYRCFHPLRPERRSGRYRRLSECLQVFHAAELVDGVGELITPCGHRFTAETVVRITSGPWHFPAAARRRWQELLRRKIAQMDTDLIRHRLLGPDALQGGVRVESPFGAAFQGLWLYDAEPAIAFVQTLALAELARRGQAAA